MLVTPPFGASSNIALWRACSKPPVELVVADLVFARKNNPMDIESIDKKCEDTDISIIRNEIELFFEDKAKLFVFKDQYFYLEGKNICMSGDNLITQKQMWRRAYRKRKAPDNAKNDDEFFAYIILPRIRNIYRSNVNNVRNSTYGYNDNPFLFFKVLRNIYICEFDETKASEPLDYVEKAIIQTKSFWILFGLGAEGYAECERAFCVRGILELCADEKYRKFLCKRIPEVEDLSLYEEVLEKLRTIRKAQMTERLEAMKKM